MNDFAKRFVELRTNKNMTQDELSSSLNISRSAIGMYETGRRMPSPEQLEIIADYFNVDMNYLLGFSSSTTVCLAASERELLECFRELNSEGQELLMQQAHFYIQNGYIKNCELELVEA